MSALFLLLEFCVAPGVQWKLPLWFFFCPRWFLEVFALVGASGWGCKLCCSVCSALEQLSSFLCFWRAVVIKRCSHIWLLNCERLLYQLSSVDAVFFPLESDLQHSSNYFRLRALCSLGCAGAELDLSDPLLWEELWKWCWLSCSDGWGWMNFTVQISTHVWIIPATVQLSLPALSKSCCPPPSFDLGKL